MKPALLYILGLSILPLSVSDWGWARGHHVPNTENLQNVRKVCGDESVTYSEKKDDRKKTMVYTWTFQFNSSECRKELEIKKSWIEADLKAHSSSDNCRNTWDIMGGPWWMFECNKPLP